MPRIPDAVDRPASSRLAEPVDDAGRRLPQVRREDITWTGGLRGQPLRVGIQFTNPSDEPTPATRARVRLAAFGAFLPWMNVGLVGVPAMAPRSRTLVRLAVPEGLVARLRADVLNDARAFAFAANVDVLVRGSKPVEVHRCSRGTLVPGSANRLHFAIGGMGDPFLEYEISILHAPATWNVVGQLMGALRCHPGSHQVPLDSVLRTSFRREHLVGNVIVPDDAIEGRIAISVRRVASGEEAVVELHLKRD